MQSNQAKFVAELNTRLLPLLNALVQSPQVATKAAMVLSIVLVIMLSIKLAEITWGFFPASIETSEQTTVTPTPAATNTKQSASLANIPQLHLFGVSTKEVKALKTGPINAPDTKLRLVLHGVFASNDPKQSLAIIAPKSGKDKTYRIGESVPGGAKLHEVYADRVILSRNGQLETLRLILARADIKVDKASSATPTKGPSSQQGVRNSSRITQFKNTIKQNPQNLLKQIRIIPVRKNGQLEGYRFTHNDLLLMRDLGIQPQDVITSINGMPVSDNSSMANLMKSIGDVGALNLTLTRNNKTENITIRFD